MIYLYAVFLQSDKILREIAIYKPIRKCPAEVTTRNGGLLGDFCGRSFAKETVVWWPGLREHSKNSVKSRNPLSSLGLEVQEKRMRFYEV